MSRISYCSIMTSICLIENQLESIAVPPPEPIIPGPAGEEDAEDIQGKSGIESGPESP
jgi:hypothetical protein